MNPKSNSYQFRIIRFILIITLLNILWIVFLIVWHVFFSGSKSIFQTSGFQNRNKSVQGPPKLLRQIEFADGLLIGPVTRKEVESMGSRILKIEEGRSDKFILMDDKMVQTRTISEFYNALQGGGEVKSIYGIGCATDFLIGLSCWRFLSESSSYRSSKFEGQWLGRLSVDHISWFGSDEREQIESDTQRNMTLMDYAAKGKIWDLKISETFVSFSTDYRDYRIEWTASGDMDRDGLEDRLILLKSWAPEGSARMYESRVAKGFHGAKDAIKTILWPEGCELLH